ncbi:MAG TPA: carbamate kinase [Nitrososphaerales archaeon]|nr:carbamate kinase [Nitrososphaerales archaeon]
MPALRILVALGGNAILRRDGKGTAEEQFENVRSACKHLVGMIRQGHAVTITHGNGPQVGDILLKDELARGTLPQMPLDVCGAESQGMLGYMIQQCLRNELREVGLDLQVATVLTETVVDADDPAFKNPTKPIGPFYKATEAIRLREERGWVLVNDSERGYRRVVPSPVPLAVVQGKVIRELVDLGVIVIAAGGGGIPVTSGGESKGVEAVIDKDLSAAVLAQVVEAEVLLILTDVENVYLDYDKPGQTQIREMTVRECREYLKRGQFAAGSMGPKIESAVRFLESGGDKVIITSLGMAEEAIAGRAGTSIVG